MATTTSFPAVRVTANPTTPYPFGLLSIAEAPTPDDIDRLGAGLSAEIESQACNKLGYTFNPCSVDDEVPPLADNVSCGWSRVAGIVVYAQNRAGGATAVADADAQALRAMQLGEQEALERAVWQRLTDAIPIATVAAGSVVDGLGEAEQALAQAYNGVAVHHLTLRAAYETKNVSKEAGKLRTITGAQVVTGQGYTESGRYYATGAVTIVAGQRMKLSTEIDRVTNGATSTFYRSFIVGFDCDAVVAVDVTRT